ncbi:MAG: hypothetical protein K6T57_12745 [Thermaceae bacterium]|nr:hypothetical protein [Thermaceae bacterium]
MKRIQLKALTVSTTLFGLATALTALAAPGPTSGHAEHFVTTGPATNVSKAGFFVPAGQLANFPLELNGSLVIQTVPGSVIYLRAKQGISELGLSTTLVDRLLGSSSIHSRRTADLGSGSTQVQTGQLAYERLGTPDWLSARLVGSPGWWGRVQNVVLIRTKQAGTVSPSQVWTTYRLTIPVNAQPGNYTLQLETRSNYGNVIQILPVRFQVFQQ